MLENKEWSVPYLRRWQIKKGGRFSIVGVKCHCCEFLQCFDTVGSVTLTDYVKSLTVKIAYGMYCDSLVWCENVFLAHTNGFVSVMIIVRS